MTKKEWQHLGFGFGTAVVLGLAAWGTVELVKKCLDHCKKHASDCCTPEDDCCPEEEGEPGLSESGLSSGQSQDGSFESQDEVVSQEFARNNDSTED